MPWPRLFGVGLVLLQSAIFLSLVRVHHNTFTTRETMHGAMTRGNLRHGALCLTSPRGVALCHVSALSCVALRCIVTPDPA